jgi:hypothetical protein
MSTPNRSPIAMPAPTSVEAEVPDGPDTITADHRGLRPAVKALLVLFLLASAAMWTYGLWGPRQDPPGTLDDPSFGRAAEPVCAAVIAQIDALPPAHRTTDHVERAAVVTQANALLTDQLDELGVLAPTSGEDARRVRDWLADWDTYLADRQDYAARLGEDADARMLETVKGGDHISQALEFFAQINAMASCAPPGDVE